MAKWLLKTEPSVYSFANLKKEGRTVWDGVSNPYAVRNIRSIKKGEQVFIYHTGDEKQIVGIAQAVSDPYPDPKFDDERYYVIDIKPVKELPRPVTLAEIKSDGRFKDSKLVKAPRLSVQPVDEKMWDLIIKMSEKK